MNAVHICLTALAVLFFASIALAQTESIYEGRIVMVDAAKKTVAVSVGDERMVFAVNDDTTITLNGARATLDELNPRLTARVVATKQSKGHVATSIDARMAP